MAQHTIQRRSFLKGLGAVVGTALVAPQLGPSAVAAKKGVAESSASMVRIGLILPEHSTLRDQFIQGLRSQYAIFDVQFMDISTPQATVPMVDLVISLLSYERSVRLASLFAGSTATMLQAGLGGRIGSFNQPAWLVEHQLPVWQAAWATGVWAAGQTRRLGVLQSLQESGFDTTYAMECGYRTGGQNVDIVWTTKTTAEIQQALDAVLGRNLSTLYIAYTGRELKEFEQVWANHPARKYVTLIGAPSMLMDRDSWTLEQITLETSWLLSTAKAPTTISVWSMLGHDVGSVIAEATEALGGDWRNRERTTYALSKAQAKSLGGSSMLTSAPAAYTMHTFQRSQKRGVEAETRPLTVLPQHSQELHAYIQQLRTGWLHEYGTI